MNTASPKPDPSAAACPVCEKPMVQAYEPFCSKRCADVDLHRWLSGQYAVPATEDDDSEGFREE